MQKYFQLIIFSLFLSSPSFGFIQKYAGLTGVFLYATAFYFLLLGIKKFSQPLIRYFNKHSKIYSIVALFSLLGGYLILHPIEDNRGEGKSSDRDEGLEMAVTRMFHGETPYYPNNKTAGPLSVLPGGIFLSAPFVAMNQVGLQNVFWFVVIYFVMRRYFKSDGLSLVLLVTAVSLSPAMIYEFISGGDMIANGIYAATAIYFLGRATESESNKNLSVILAFVACGIALASRFNLIFLLPVICGYCWRSRGIGYGIRAGVVISATLTALIIPYYLHDPHGFTPLLSKNKLGLVDQVFPWASNAIVAVTAVLSLYAMWRILSSQCSYYYIFRWCAMITLCPMLLAILLSSIVHHGIDFSLLKDRFGLMYVFFALLGWGNELIARNDNLEVSCLN